MIVVTGATGTVGRDVVRLLIEAGEKVTAVSRHIADAPDGAVPMRADLADAASLRPALEGADAVFLCPAGDLLTGAGSPAEIVEAIEAAGVRRVVLLSSQASETRPEAVSHARLREFEGVLRASGPHWTILRPGGFASNTYAHIPGVRADRTVAAPFGDVGLPLVDPADIAEVAAAALRDGRHDGRTYVLTGPAAVTPREQAAAIGAAIGVELGFTELTREQAMARLSQVMPVPVAEGTLDIMGSPTDAELAISPHVEDVLGRAPRSFAEWAGRNAAAFGTMAG
ncbi:NmrA family transcriptional regulator [Actinomadura sp. CNU-125]|uniref:SDR family oxidoreductase n=1 Tax=Actinomadura sp. CNU-125 TaxID=1904961 RepID=UPI00096067E3|nr:NAD(P)H-binding protein [Actinomadura sp. CNU-125]OLT20317.1 NmrA family transcriptional regulator [Actinomadura sp. CNU-125]